ncbi:MAG: PfkB family carbohydrate kinase [Patescibacteria group bacterium]
MDQTSLIVIGAVNTDLIASGISGFPKPNQLARGEHFKIGPGGKSRNIAAMAGYLMPEGSVAMIARTAEDSFGLWKPPMDDLAKARVNTDYIRVMKASETDKFPSIALLGVDADGNNQCFMIMGASDDFSTQDIDDAAPLFDAAKQNQGIFALSLECPLDTARHAIDKAHSLGLRTILDPGGIIDTMDISDLLRQGVYLIKPNEHEAELITGMVVNDFDSARVAADKLKQEGAKNVLITNGENGAYLFTEQEELHIPIPQVADGGEKDATGCGDQTMAVLCAYLQEGKSLVEAAKIAVLAGTLQFYKAGIQPITKQELEAQL